MDTDQEEMDMTRDRAGIDGHGEGVEAEKGPRRERRRLQSQGR